jgi:hypothetical protein
MVVQYVPHQGDKWQTPEDILNDPLFAEPPAMPAEYHRWPDETLGDVRDKLYRVAKAPPPSHPSSDRFLRFASGESRKVWPSLRWENHLQDQWHDAIGSEDGVDRFDPKSDLFDYRALNKQKLIVDRPTKGKPPLDLMTGEAVTVVSRRVLDVILEIDPDGVVWTELKPISTSGEELEHVYSVWLRCVIPVIDWARTSVYVKWGVDYKTGQYNGMKWVKYCNDPVFRGDVPPGAHLCRDAHYRGLNLYSAAFVAELAKRKMPNDGDFYSISESMPF